MVHYVILNNIKIEYIKIGKGPTLLFMPGAFSSFRFYLQIILQLSKNYTVYCFSMPGCGRSGKMHKNNNERLYESITTDFIDKVVHSQGITLVGHSLGGYIGLKILKYYPKNYFANIVIINTPIKLYGNFFFRTFKGWTSLIFLHLKNIGKINLSQIIPFDAVNIIFFRFVDFIKINILITKLSVTRQDLQKNSNELIHVFLNHSDHYVTYDYSSEILKIHKKCQVVNAPELGHAWFIYKPEVLVNYFKSFSKAGYPSSLATSQ